MLFVLTVCKPFGSVCFAKSGILAKAGFAFGERRVVVYVFHNT